jgi:uncharacterized surface anchored protein
MSLNIKVFFLGFLLLQVFSAYVLKQEPAQSKATTSDIVGIVTDPQGAVVEGATVTATEKESGSTRKTVTDSEGKFAFRNLQAGTYKVVIELSGFKETTIDDVRVTFGAISRLEPILGADVEPVTEPVLGKIKGTVKNDVSDQPIEGASVVITQLSPEKIFDEIKTDSEGKYEKAGLIPTKYKVHAEASGFRPSERTVQLTNREVKIVDFSLTPR